MLNLIVNPNDAVSLRFWLGMGSNSWLANQYMTILEIAKTEGKNVREILDECISGRDIKKINKLKDAYSTLCEAKSSIANLTLVELVDHLFPQHQETTKILREASLLAISKNPEVTVEELWDCLESLITQPEMPEAGDFVRIMSLHKSKGLTSRVTIITSCIQGLIPNIDDELKGTEKDDFLCEQRRLFYVGLTRAKEYLVLSSFNQIKTKLAFKIGAKFQRRGSLAETINSAFITELGQNCPTVMLGADWEKSGFN